MGFNIQLENFAEHSNQQIGHTPTFTEVEPDIDIIRQYKQKKNYENLIVIGNGGSITSFRALYYAFLDKIDKNVRLVTTMDPDYLTRIRDEFKPEETLVMPISKSGNTTSVIESTIYFANHGYQILPVTSNNNGALKQIIDKRDYDWIEHREVGGRFSGLTETGLAPAEFVGLDAKKIREGGEQIYQKLEEEKMNPALHLANNIYNSEGHNEILTPFYSTRLFGFYPLLVQLIHETVCKEGKGKTVYGDLGPEYQHHTNQRLFGGKKNVIPLFFTKTGNTQLEIDIKHDLKDVSLRNKKLNDLNNIDLSQSLQAEYKGVKNALEEENIPNATLEVDKLDYQTAGEIMGFLQYLAVYLAKLNNVDPYNQPDVEKSKQKGFEERFK